MPLLKGNLHAHTTFSDGRRPVAEVVGRQEETPQFCVAGETELLSP